MRRWWRIAVGGLFLSVALPCGVLLFLVSRPLDFPTESVAYNLERGTSMRAMLGDFKSNGWIDDTRPLLVWARLFSAGRRLKAGEYRFEAGINAREALKILTSGRSELRQLTFIEGRTFMHAFERMRASDLIMDWNTPEIVKRELGLDHYQNMEGLIFPDTYHYQRGMRVSEVLRVAHKRMSDLLAKEWEKRALSTPYKSPYDALIIASIVEKETALKEEQSRVAGVLVRRIELDMRLAADPTVIYGLGADFDGNIRRRHLQSKDNPYNTYKHLGLPPTPISLVSRSALHAAMHPAEESALYFVARGDGSHVFSNTLEEHEHWVRQYQLR